VLFGNAGSPEIFDNERRRLSTVIMIAFVVVQAIVNFNKNVLMLSGGNVFTSGSDHYYRKNPTNEPALRP